jgi:GntR family transcriptional regulator
VEIDHRGETPPHRQIAAWLREQITSGQIAPGRPLPSERELVQAFGVAHTTVRRALAVLRDEGIVYTVAGRGSYAAKDAPQDSGG